MNNNSATLGSRDAQFGVTVLALVALSIFINYVDRGNLATAAPLIKSELRLTNTQYGFLVSAFFWVYVPGQLVASWLVQQLNAYRTLAIGLAVWSLATIASGLATGFATLLLFRVLLGIGESAGFPASSKLLAQHLAPERLGMANGLVSSGIYFGPAIGTFVGGLLLVHVGWRLLFVMFGALSLVWLIPWITQTRALSNHARADPSSVCRRFANYCRSVSFGGPASAIFARTTLSTWCFPGCHSISSR